MKKFMRCVLFGVLLGLLGVVVAAPGPNLKPTTIPPPPGTCPDCSGYPITTQGTYDRDQCNLDCGNEIVAVSAPDDSGEKSMTVQAKCDRVKALLPASGSRTTTSVGTNQCKITYSSSNN